MKDNIKKLGRKNIRILIDRLVPFDSLSNMSIYGNVYCPFHDDRNKPSAHCYVDDDGAVKLYCFQEHRFYGSYDYLKLIKGIDPIKYLNDNFSNKDLESVIKILETDGSLFHGIEDNRSDEIHNKWTESLEDVVSFADSLYIGFKQGEII